MKKNMERSKNPDSYWTLNDVALPIEVGLYYGFSQGTPIVPEKQDFDKVKEYEEDALPQSGPRIHPEEIAALLRIHFIKGPSSLPVMLVRARKLEPRTKHREYSFDILGTNRSIADATVIKAAYETAVELGYEDISVELNSMGDRESFSRFLRELGIYFKKHTSELDPECKQALKKSALSILECSHEKCIEVKAHAPRPMNYFSEVSRIHFKEVLELMETAHVPYIINTTLIDNPGYTCHTVFTITGKEKDKKDSTIIARGARFVQIGKKLGLKKDVLGITATFMLHENAPKAVARIAKPKLYLIQMGQDAKCKSLTVIEVLRKARIPLHHSLTKDKFAVQLMSAEHYKVPYILIIGQKESLEHTILVRETSTRSQETVKILEIADYIKNLFT